MSDRSFALTKRSKKSNYSSLSKPSYRVIYKSRSGALDDINSASSHQLRTSNTKLNITTNSFCTNELNNMDKNSHNRTLSSLKPMMTNSGDFYSVGQVLSSDRFPKIDSRSIEEPLMELQEQNFDQLSIGQVQQKVDTLIQLKLQKASENKEEKTPETQIIDKQMNKIIRYLQREKQGQNLQVANKKIEILQKIIAESSIQSQIAKKYYFKKINNKKQKIPNISQYQVNMNDLKQKTKKLMQMNPPASIHFQSTCQINYKAPQKKDYPLAQPKAKHIPNNQPLPRSSYGCDYLAYNNLPKYKYEQSTTTQAMPTMGKRNSSYQEDFTIKKIEKINFKELDCYQDKFKNLKIPLIHSTSRPFEQLKPLSPAVAKYKTLQNPQDTDHKLKRFKTQTAHYIQNLSTQNRVNFRGENNNIKSAIKHQKLNKYKYAYKAIVHA